VLVSFIEQFTVMKNQHSQLTLITVTTSIRVRNCNL